MANFEELNCTLKSLDPFEAFKTLNITPIDKKLDFSQLPRFLDYIPIDRRYESVKLLHTSIDEIPILTCSSLSTLLAKLREDDVLRTMIVIEKRISPFLQISELHRVLDRTPERDRFKIIQILVGIMSSSGEVQESLDINRLSAIVQKIPNFSLATVTALKPWVAKDLDFTKMRQLLESCPDKNSRLEILAELTSVSISSPAVLRCADIHSILFLLPQRIAEKGLKIISHLISPDLDIHRVQLVFEGVMKTDQVKVLTTLMSACETRVGFMSEIRAIVEKMDQPFKGLECLKEKIEPNIDINKISTVLDVIPGIKQLDSLQFLLEQVPFEVNPTQLSAFEVRSILMSMGVNSTEALRLLLPRFEIFSDRDVERILECFSDANRPIAEKILYQKNKM